MTLLTTHSGDLHPMQLIQRSPAFMVLEGPGCEDSDPEVLARARASQASGTHLLRVASATVPDAAAPSPELVQTIGTRFVTLRAREASAAQGSGGEGAIVAGESTPSGRTPCSSEASPAAAPGADDVARGALESTLAGAPEAGEWALQATPGDAFTLPLLAHPSGAGHRILVSSPGGRGLRLVVAPGEPELVDHVERCLLERDTVTEWRDVLWRHALESAARLDRDSRFDRADARRADPPRLDLADPGSAAVFEHRATGGEEACTLQALDAGGRELCDLGRRVVGGESFGLHLDPERERARPQPLVLVRRTAPHDAGKVLRVELDDEDLGPWHLGNHGVPGRISDDVFRIPAEVLLDRSSARLTLHAEPGVRIDSYRVRFLRESDPDGLWLTELDPDRVDGDPPRFDQNARGDALQVCGRLFLRGLGVRGPLALEYRVAAGYRWFDGQIGVDDDSPSFARAQLRILVDGEERFRSVELTRGDCALPARVALDGACTLRLQFSSLGVGELHANLGDPVLLR